MRMSGVANKQLDEPIREQPTSSFGPAATEAVLKEFHNKSGPSVSWRGPSVRNAIKKLEKKISDEKRQKSGPMRAYAREDAKSHEPSIKGNTIKQGSINEAIQGGTKKEYDERLRIKDTYIKSAISQIEAAKEAVKKAQKSFQNCLEKTLTNISNRLSTIEQTVKRLGEQVDRHTEAQKRPIQYSKEAPKHAEQAQKQEDLLMSSCRQQSNKSLEVKFRGKLHNPEASARSFFGSGLYCDVIEEMDDWKDSDLGDLLVGTTKHSFVGVRETLLWGCTVLMTELFQYQPKMLRSAEERDRLHDISNAYGLLIHHFKDECWRSVEENFSNSVKKDTIFHKQFQKVQNSGHKDMFNEFKINLQKQMKSMLSVSPPMVIHFPKTFEKEMIERIQETSEQHPLKWLQPVVMNNYYGMVCVKGRAGNKDDLLKLESS